MKLAKKKNISWGSFAIAFVFLFNPNIAVIDPLPDIFGYVILSILLTKPAMISESLYDAKRAFERMIIVDAGKLLSILWVFGIDAVSERNTSLLLWTFVFGVLEALFAIPAYMKLFEGLSSLGNFYPNTSLHGKKKERSKSYTDSIKIFSVFFVVFKAVFTCLPELTVLGASTYDESSRFLELYRYIGVIRVLCALPVIVVGVAWLVSAVRYFVRVSRDTAFVESINDAYMQKRLNKTGAFVIKDVKIATAFLVIASVLTLDFNLDGINVIPDVFVVAALGISLYYFSKAVRIKKILPIVIFLLYTAATLFEDYARYYFANNYYYNAINKNEEAFVFYIITVVAVAVEGFLLVLMYFAMTRSVRSVIIEHTGYVLGKEIKSEGEQKQIEIVQKRLSKNFSIVTDVVVLCVLADSFGSLYGAFYAFLNRNFGWMSLISLACGFLLIGMTVKAVSELNEAVQTKYMFE